MENFKMIEKIDFELNPYGVDCSETIKLLNNYLNKINQIFYKEQNNFAELCYYVFKVKELFDSKFYKMYYGRLVTKQKDYIFFDNIMEGIGLDKTAVSRILSCYEKFVVKDENIKPLIIAPFGQFSKSKLFELLNVDIEQLRVDFNNKVLRPDMSVKSIRDYVKNYKAQQRQKEKLFQNEEKEIEENINEEDIPEAYNPKQHYDFNYFEDKTKAQLLNIVWQLQTEYEKLKKDLKKNNKKG